jgi:hypothetical protein
MPASPLSFPAPDHTNDAGRLLTAVAALGALSLCFSGLQGVSTGGPGELPAAHSLAPSLLPRQHRATPLAAPEGRDARPYMSFYAPFLLNALSLASRPGASAPRLEGRRRSPPGEHH